MKKFKLLASIASMCLAIAVLCFGVFAASSVTYQISGTISYDVSDVFVNVKTTVYSYANNLSEANLKTYADAIAAKNAVAATQTDVTVGTGKATFTYVTGKTGDYAYGGTPSGIIGGTANALTTSTDGLKLAYSNTAGYSYFIVINVKNLASKSLKITPDNANGTWGASVNSVHYVSASSTGVAKDASTNLVIAMSIIDKKVAINSGNTFSLKLTFAY